MVLPSRIKLNTSGKYFGGYLRHTPSNDPWLPRQNLQFEHTAIFYLLSKITRHKNINRFPAKSVDPCLWKAQGTTGRAVKSVVSFVVTKKSHLNR
jgi:hypothetical protein